MPNTPIKTNKQYHEPIAKVILKEVKAETNGWITRAVTLWKGIYQTPSGALVEVFSVDIIKRGRLAERQAFGNNECEAENFYFETIRANVWVG